ncbi:C45 family autoproteolytic acyltransferase/hydolase [Natronorubrum sulfidifaciens]|uniref:Peptidase C45 acyl-coenzyme A:6-aminopenicillanic acid acyl-transferase n=1 Tax=Natronorubrum sulfidifaciens JCM 14089 TaxID=1230460 RepID=L9WBH1_9EURY|nr:C45 family peptidase [Natronorubrum sulfidifaciens]ELY46707.1 peptidase C45 acyl-coenzyme A:6- aminopenicillanic acid acyl-transferase [Natronorubrum sulfidifaciens JCM 14089]
MNEPDGDTTAYSDVIADSETFADRARRRAELEREAVEWAIDELESEITAQNVVLGPLLEYARRSRASLPERHRRAYEAMAEVFDVDSDVYEVYVFAYAELCEELAGEGGRSEKHPQGCTNALVIPSRLESNGGETPDTGPLVLKSRDISGRGTRPKSIVEQPPIDDYYGFLTVDTCGTISIYKGVNDQGLVAANTYIDCNRDDVAPETQLRNGTVIRMLLEECATVAEARAFLESHPTRQLMSQTLFLADGTEGVLLEIDPAAERIAVDDDPVVTRTNHFVRSASTETASSTTRRQRALELLDSMDGINRDKLWTIAQDHENGPGDDSICRHPEPETDEPHAFGQLTTASAAVFEGGSPVIDIATGNPCELERTRCAFGDEIPTDLRTGQRWLERRQ